MTVEFKYDVFLSHSSKDKTIARRLAERLQNDGAKVWFDEWKIRPGDSIPVKIEEGLENSRVLVLCMSANAFGSDWAQLEDGTFRFRDPLNKERRFIPLRLDKVPIKGTLAQFLYIDWNLDNREQEYVKLLEACLPKIKSSAGVIKNIGQQVPKRVIHLELIDRKDEISTFAFNSDSKYALTGHYSGNLRFWDLETAKCQYVVKGHKKQINRIVFSPNQCHALSCSLDPNICQWNVETGELLHTFKGHTGLILSVECSSDGRFAISSGTDSTLRVWDLKTGKCLRVHEGHAEAIVGVTLSPNGRLAISASIDDTLKMWDLSTWKCRHVFKGHTSGVLNAAWSTDQRYFLSCSADATVRLWDTRDRRCIRVFEGHSGQVNDVQWIARNQYALSFSSDDLSIRLWNIRKGHCEGVLEHSSEVRRGIGWNAKSSKAYSGETTGIVNEWNMRNIIGSMRMAKSFTIKKPNRVPDQIQYTNAKVLLVGDSGAGKTGLSNRLALSMYKETDSTVGAWATQWNLQMKSKDNIEREIWLWDFGGQADQRLIHQLYMDQTHLAILVFDPQKNDLFDTLDTWDRDLTRSAKQEFQKMLVAGRIDAGGLRSASRSQIERFAKERGFACYIETSAKENLGCEDLKRTIIKLIDWNQIAQRTTPTLFRFLKEEIIRLKDEGRVLMRFNELREALNLRLIDKQFSDEELKVVISLLAGPGVVWELGFGSWILLKPDLINSYAQAVIRSLREDEREIGCISEGKVLSGELSFPEEKKRLPTDEERIVLLAMHQILVERGLCLREEDPEGKAPTILVFPSYVRRERPELIEYPSVIVSYQFNGFLDDIYTTLIVRLHHTDAFERDQLWREAADFKTMTGNRLGVKMTRRANGAGEVEVYFDPDIPVGEMMIFSKYIHEHLLKKARDVVRLRHYVCSKCRTPVANRDVAMRRVQEKGKRASIICVECERRVKLWDELEERFADPELQKCVRELEEDSKVILDNESKDRALVGEVISTVALAGQISREFSVSDHGIDMEVEFKDDTGEATGEKLYLQLKSGDSHLSKRKRDGAEIFKISKQRHADYWSKQKFPVMLVIRTSDGNIRWMEIRGYLKREVKASKKKVRQIVFEGKRFDVMSVRRLREKALG
ncbi:TIR domain-containing protein [Candidatus Parcubacteria bacterium]|nr:MAG: TIR domain-containing protein [Candidatus Parcubacteria bacterium]